MKILSIDTSCDETAAAVTDGTKILSNVIWSQASAHAKFGGVMPSLAQRMHEERIDFVVEKALKTAFPKSPYTIYDILNTQIDAIAVTIGPGLSIALGVGIAKAKELAIKYKKPLIAVNHLEAHILSSFANSEITNFQLPISNELSNFQFPILGLVISGGNTQLVQINNIGDYKILAETQDDALGEALDKAARMLGLGYPGGAILEKFAKLGDPKIYKLPIPMVGQEKRMMFSYSGLKTSMMRKIEEVKVKNENLTKQQIYDLAASFQDVAFAHLLRVLKFVICNLKFEISDLLVGGGVSANIELRKRLRKLCKEFNIKVHFPINKKLTGDNAAMIGIVASFKAERGEFIDPEVIDRNPRAKLINQDAFL